MKLAEPLLRRLLETRLKAGKEDATRLPEKQGLAGIPRPDGPLLWLHAASVGEAQSAQIIIHRLLARWPELHILATTVTRTSAGMLEQNLPPRAFHQFYPLDHPDWTSRFLDHWRPNMALWMESELWPAMLSQIKTRGIPAALLNARLSDKSFTRWQFLKPLARGALTCFDIVLTQTQGDADKFLKLGSRGVIVSGNLKYSAKPLSANTNDLKLLNAAIDGRPVWVFASTHDAEEVMASEIHQQLKAALPDILTIIIPRHPHRRNEILSACRQTGIVITLRGENKTLPEAETDIYIADTMGEMGLFYRAGPLVVMGRSFSKDGGGGHNPIEPAQLNCGILYGPNVQFQQALFDDLSQAGGAIQAVSAEELTTLLRTYLQQPEKRSELQNNALNFCRSRSDVLEAVFQNLEPALYSAGMPGMESSQKARA